MYCRWSNRTAFSDVHLFKCYCMLGGIIYRIIVVRLKDSAFRITISTSRKKDTTTELINSKLKSFIRFTHQIGRAHV